MIPSPQFAGRESVDWPAAVGGGFLIDKGREDLFFFLLLLFGKGERSMREVVMACRTLGLATALILVASCLAQDRGGGDPGVAWPLIGSVLKEAQVSGSLEYWGHCGSGMWRPDFPKIRPLSESSGSPLEVLQRAFANDPKMRVTQEPGGMIRMAETDVPSDLLDVKISHVSFHLPGSADMYGPNYALWLSLIHI